jgi:hypothetical protein
MDAVFAENQAGWFARYPFWNQFAYSSRYLFQRHNSLQTSSGAVARGIDTPFTKPRC